MSMCRRFNGAPVVRVIVSVPADMVAMVDCLLAGPHPARGCRAEFVRLAVADRLARDLMFYGRPKGDDSRGGVSPETAASIKDIDHARRLQTISGNQAQQGPQARAAEGVSSGQERALLNGKRTQVEGA